MCAARWEQRSRGLLCPVGRLVTGCLCGQRFGAALGVNQLLLAGELIGDVVARLLGGGHRGAFEKEILGVQDGFAAFQFFFRGCIGVGAGGHRGIGGQAEPGISLGQVARILGVDRQRGEGVVVIEDAPVQVPHPTLGLLAAEQRRAATPFKGQFQVTIHPQAFFVISAEMELGHLVITLRGFFHPSRGFKVITSHRFVGALVGIDHRHFILRLAIAGLGARLERGKFLLRRQVELRFFRRGGVSDGHRNDNSGSGLRRRLGGGVDEPAFNQLREGGSRRKLSGVADEEGFFFDVFTYSAAEIARIFAD